MLEYLKSYATVFLISMVPVAELRGAIPAGIAIGLRPVTVLIVSVMGNMLPVPFIILFIRKIFLWMKRQKGVLLRIVEFCEEKASRGAELFYKYELLGLFILVAIPLPGTGAWTGALVAAMLNLRLKVSVPAIFLGVCVAGAIMLTLSCGVDALFAFAPVSKGI